MKTITPKQKKQLLIIILAALVLIIGILVFAIVQLTKPDEDAEVISISTLEKIINVSELSTFTAVYNGIAEVPNEKRPEKIDCYVAYEAKVKAGIDFEQVEISIDNDTKTIEVALPDVYITEVTVEMSSLDFIFYNEKANASTITETAYKACNADVQAESEQQDAIVELARQNASTILTALIKPIIEQLDEGYTLIIS